MVDRSSIIHFTTFIFIAFLCLNATIGDSTPDSIIEERKSEELEQEVPNEEIPPISPFDLAIEYQKGLNGKTKDIQQAIQLFEQAGKEGNSQAYYELGRIYEEGEQIPRNFSEAMRYFNISADSGNPKAQRELAFLWGTGKGVSLNKPLSLLYYAFASQGGDIEAKMALGYRYLFGIGVTKSCKKAVEKYEAVATAVVEEMRSSGMEYQSEPVRLHEAFESNRDRSREEEDIVQYYQYSADTGDADAQVTMGSLFLHGSYGVERNYQQAFHYFQQAANAGSSAGLSNLGLMYAQGHGTEQNNETAVKLYKQAAEKGSSQAQSNLGYMYLYGYGVPKSISDAFRYFKMAADQGNPEGQLNLGILYYNGDPNGVVKQDYSKSLSYFSMAAQQGHLVALYNLAQMHQYGLGTSPSCAFAVHMYKKLSEKAKRFQNTLLEANQLYQRGKLEESLLKYERLAEQGFEIAQNNAAWLIDHHLAEINGSQFSKFFVDQELAQKAAFTYFRNSAEQKSAFAHVRLGDYYFYGLGVPVDYEKAALYYQAASDMRNPHAMFNMGYMHQKGLGLPKDLHLAKRHYDMALETETNAYLAVYLALLSLGADFVLHWISTGQLQFAGYKWDTILIFFLLTILILLLIIRRLRN